MYVHMCTIMYMKVYEFRKDLKKHFDQALKEPVYIERGGVIFQLTRHGIISTNLVDLSVSDWDTKGEDITLRAERIERVSECKNGHLSDEHGKCNWKGCKYARK